MIEKEEYVEPTDPKPERAYAYIEAKINGNQVLIHTGAIGTNERNSNVRGVAIPTLAEFEATLSDYGWPLDLISG
jgi:hypothetical protein